MTDTLIILGRQGILAAPTRNAGIGTADPFATGRQIAFQDDAGFSSGHVSIDDGVAIQGLPHAEVIVLAAGSISVDGNPFAKGEALVLPKGFSGALTISAGTRWFFCAMEAGAGGSEQTAIRLDVSLPRPASPGPAPGVVIGPAPQCHSLNGFTDPSGMRAGVWDVTTPCERTFVPHRVHELMHIIEGEVTLTHRRGTEDIFKAGDTVLVPRGAPYAWKNSGRVVKYYCVN